MSGDVTQGGVIRVAVVDDDALFRSLIKKHLAEDARIELVGEGATGRDALRLNNRLQPDVIVMDVNMPVLNGVEAARRITAQHPGVGIILLTASVNLLVGSASAKWALLAPIFVPMLMQLGISPELTQAAYRVGDSTTNIITPLMPYFPLVVVFCQRYVKNTGIGTVVSMMLPYSVSLLVTWALFLLLYWAVGIPLGLQASYTYPH